MELLAGRVAIAFLEEVLEPQLERVGVEPLGEHVHRPLGRPHSLHLSVAPKGPVRREVRVDAARLDRDVGNPVRPRSREAHLLRDAGPAVGVGAGVRPALDLLREERPVGACAQADPDHRRMAVERQPFLVPLEDGTDGTAGLASQAGDDRLEADERLRPEGTAHGRAHDPDPVLGDAEDPGEIGAEVEGRLRPRPDLAAARPPTRHARVRLHVRVLGAGRPEGLLDDHVGLGEARVDVALAEAETVADVRALLRPDPEVGGVVLGDVVAVVDERGVLVARLDRVEHGVELLVVDFDQRERLVRLAQRLGGDGGDGIAGEAGPVAREHGLILDLGAVRPQVRDVAGRERDDTRRDRRGVDAPDPGVRVGRAQDARLEHPFELHVLGVADGAGDARVRHAVRSSSSARRTSTRITRRR